jgi:hypothetical protein
MDDITTKHDPLEPEENPQVAYEHSDADIVTVSKYAIALVFGVLIAASAMWGLFDYFSAHSNEDETVVSKAVLEERDKLSPQQPLRVTPKLEMNEAPHLQATPKLYIKELHALEDEYLTSYGWVEPSQGIVRIPIQEAIAMVAKKGLPSRPVKSDDGLDQNGYREMPAVSSSGRTKERIR